MSARSHSHYVTSSKATAIAAGRVSEAGPVGEYSVSVLLRTCSTYYGPAYYGHLLLRRCGVGWPRVDPPTHDVLRLSK